MHNGQRPGMNGRQRKPATSFPARPNKWIPNVTRSEPKGTQGARKNYERYLALARAEVLAGNTVAAENYYQHAEHYLRSMSSDQG
jgi:hypothetical protein